MKANRVEHFMIYSLLFVSFTFPKAGLVLGGVPLTIQEGLFAIVLLMEIFDIFFKKKANKEIFYSILLLFVCLFVTVLVNLTDFYMSRILYGIVLILSPLGFYFCEGLNIDKINKIILISILITCSFAIIQYFFGVEQTKIPGVTIAIGESYANKPIGFDSVTGMAKKMPSTYQNGNGFGLFLSLVFPYSITMKFEEKKWNGLKYVALFLSIIGIFIAGSRTALFSLIIALIVCFVILFPNIIQKRFSKRAFFVAVVTLIVVITGIVFNWNLISTRFINSMIEDPGGNGRIDQYKSFFEKLSNDDVISLLKDTFLGSIGSNGIWLEGFLSIWSFFGIVSMIIYVLLMIYEIIKSKATILSKIGLLSVFVAFCFDSSFYFMPAVFSFFVILNVSNRRRIYEK